MEWYDNSWSTILNYIINFKRTPFLRSQFSSFLVIFTTDNRFLALKTEENVVRSNGHQFSEVKFWTFLVNFTTNNRFLALKHEGNVLGPNGHQFWEVKFWWFLAIFDRFYHIKSKCGSKTRRKRPTAKRTPVLSSHFVMIFGEFWPFLPYQIGIRH